MSSMPLLSIVTFLPLVGAAFIFLARGPEEIVARNARSVALWTTSITFLVSLLLWLNFDNNTAQFQFVEKTDWIGAGINYHMGVDGISMLFVLLTTFLMPRSEEHTSELQSLMRISYAVFCLKKKKKKL